jgi:hypothetical protein
MTKPGRIACCVPFCRRTASATRFADSEEIICGPHWRAIRPAIRARRTQLKARARRVERLLMRKGFRHKPGLVTKVDGMERAFDRLWARHWQELKAAAIESAAGVS